MSTLTQEQVKQIQDFCDEYDYNFRENYSGRGMMGRNCIGMVADGIDPFTVAMEMVEYLEGEPILDIFKQCGGVSMDNMGRSAMIMYFPSINIEKEDTDGD